MPCPDFQACTEGTAGVGIECALRSNTMGLWAAGAGALGALGAQLATAAQAPPQPIAGASSNGAPPSAEPAPEAGEAAAA
jgi:hypothetical protein